MKWIYLTAIAVMGLVCAFTSPPATHKSGKAVVSPHQDPAKDALIKRGQYLVTVMGCGDCHAPKKMTPQGPRPDMDRFLAGYNSAEPLGEYDKNLVKTGQWMLFNGQNTAFIGPWGVSFAANLTPDASGIGKWSLTQFSKAMRQGKLKGLDNARPLLPPMPWPNYTNMTDGDLKAIFSYLKSLKPVANVVPAPRPPLP
ncbi:c-type cytochrome [Fibrella forsythiae]|uniref:C-type cytochrome n=1 Tax=Fibrella forsythiae TaxID=2817061 RepID=A0ABS3JS93_9BACT|nr:c-type cytochrome [Fibrella forsythiae]MBO0952880.1 c-type cytochrome [Fibrella forsythiae]